jgi:hypothetical protein
MQSLGIRGPSRYVSILNQRQSKREKQTAYLTPSNVFVIGWLIIFVFNAPSVERTIFETAIKVFDIAHHPRNTPAPIP